jgi:competence protein ComFC
MPALRSSLGLVFRSVRDFVFPPICYGCDAEADHGLVCEPCRLLLFTSELDVCPRCHRPALHPGARCDHCKHPLSLSRVRALGLYQPPFNKLVHAFKYSGKAKVGELLGNALAMLVNQDTALRENDIVCPIPLHPARQRERGFNQSLLLAAAVSVGTGIRLGQSIVRCKNTPSQTTKISPEERRKNLADAFALSDGSDVKGKRVLLVDDVCTVGATLDSAGKVLLQAGAAEVMGVVVAA